jgi:hypothetical protein
VHDQHPALAGTSSLPMRAVVDALYRLTHAARGKFPDIARGPKAPRKSVNPYVSQRVEPETPPEVDGTANYAKVRQGETQPVIYLVCASQSRQQNLGGERGRIHSRSNWRLLAAQSEDTSFQVRKLAGHRIVHRFTEQRLARSRARREARTGVHRIT